MLRVWKELIPTFMDDFKGLKTLVEEVTADVVEITRELEWEVEPEDGTELLQCHDQASVDDELLLRISKESGFLRWILLLVKMLGRLLKWPQRI